MKSKIKSKIKSWIASWLVVLPLVMVQTAKAEDDHDHEHEEENHEEEEVVIDPTTVGPEKGVVAKSPEGFKLAPEAEQTFKYQTLAYAGSSLEIPREALVRIKAERSVYRLRDGWIKRIPVKTPGKNKDKVQIQSTELKSGDEVITSGAGFLRVTEIFIEGGASHGHSH